MATQVRLRRGTTAQHASFTGAEGEVTVDTDKETLVVHDGSTAGGHPLAKAAQARGWTKREHFTSNGTWTKSGKSDLKRIIVTTHGGGGGGHASYWAGAGGQGGVGYAVMDVSTVTTNVTVTVGGGGATGTNGGTTSFGTYLVSNGGTAGGSNGSYLGQGGKGGNVSGNASTVDLGGHPGDGGAGYSATANSNFGPPYASAGGGPGGGSSHPNVANYNATGVLGGGGASAGTGADGSVIVEEIYGEV